VRGERARREHPEQRVIISNNAATADNFERIYNVACNPTHNDANFLWTPAKLQVHTFKNEQNKCRQKRIIGVFAQNEASEMESVCLKPKLPAAKMTTPSANILSDVK
jgi:hypothetical protein